MIESKVFGRFELVWIIRYTIKLLIARAWYSLVETMKQTIAAHNVLNNWHGGTLRVQRIEHDVWVRAVYFLGNTYGSHTEQ